MSIAGSRSAAALAAGAAAGTAACTNSNESEVANTRVLCAIRNSISLIGHGERGNSRVEPDAESTRARGCMAALEGEWQCDARPRMIPPLPSMYVMHTLESSHPAVAAWFARTHPAPTEAQAQAWPAIQAGRDVLVAAPTGSGTTLAAFLAAIDQLVKEGAAGVLPDETRVLYISPLKALSNDIHRNLEAPLEGIRAERAALGLQDVDIRTVVRTGDTSQSERARIRRKAPHIVVTTPESLYVLLGSPSGRSMLATCRAVIVDEIHAVAANKRGTHLALSLERLQAITGRRPARVGLSATQTPIEEVARFLTGANRALGDCVIVDLGAARNRDLALELPPVPLEPVMSGEAWVQVYDRLAELVREHPTPPGFVNPPPLGRTDGRH